MLRFSQITGYKPGIIFSLLKKSYEEVWNDKLEQSLREFDKEVFENPNTVVACTFISTLEHFYD